MAHQVEACDFLDVLEEAVTLGTEVIIDVRHGGQFTDRVRKVITDGGEDVAVFKNHDRLPLHAITNARRARAREPSYEGKLGQ